MMNPASVIKRPRLEGVRHGFAPRSGLFAGFCAGLFAILAVLLGPLPALAETGPWIETGESAVRLVSAVDAAGDLDSLPFGIEIRLRPGWKTYWRSPGEAGFPPTVDWSGSANVAAVRLDFPVPHRFELFDLQTFGYGDEVVFPLAVTPARKGSSVDLRLHLKYLVCAEVCIPHEHDLALALDAGAAMPSAEAPLVNRFAALVPDDGTKFGLKLDGVSVEDDRLIVEADALGASFQAPDLIIEGPSDLYFGKPSVELLAAGRRARLILAIERNAGAPDPAAAELTLTLIDGLRGLERKLVPAAFAPIATIPAGTGALGFIAILLMALLGGLILNVMPCVLPVLALKLTGILEQGGQVQRATRLSFLATASGIVASFLILAGTLVGLKQAGFVIGWGIQFQQPWFLGALILICLAFAANLWGWFEIPMPAFAGTAASLTNRAERRRPLVGAFLAGALATIMATPCSAPFVGSAVAFALSRGPAEIMLVFLFLGLGLSIPYLLVAAKPRLVAWLPRPGRWMKGLRALLGISLAGTALWLGLALAHELGFVSRSGEGGPGTLAWRNFDETAIPGFVAQGKIVFVDVTAEWCLTCKANKELVIEASPVAKKLQAAGIVLLKADWTNPDPAISAYLAGFGRYGIPMNVVYGPQAPAGILLPELLSAGSVLDALDKAGALGQ